MHETELMDYIKVRTKVFNRSGGFCEVCGEPISFDDYQLAHRIPQRKYNLAKYGKRVIHHPLNLVATCSLRCNTAVSLNTHTEEVRLLVESIEERLEADNER